MLIRNSPNAILLAAVLVSTACSTSELDPSVGADAAGDASPDAGDTDRATEGGSVDTSADAEGPEAADASRAPFDAGDATSPDANEDRMAVADARDESEGSLLADANDASEAKADADDAAEGGDQPSEFAYVATYLGGISAFSIDTTTGALGAVPGSPFDQGAGFYAIAVTASGHFAYAADFLHSRINGYRIVRNGALQPLPTSPVDSGGAPVGLTVDPAERFVFAGSSEGPSRIFVYRIDRTTGALTPVDHSPFGTTDDPATLAVDPQSRFLFVSSRVAPGIRVFAIGDASGALSEVSGSPFGTATVFGGGIAFSQVGNFVYNGGNGVNAFLYDVASGAMTDIEGSPFGQALSDATAVNIATDSTGSYVFAVYTFMQTLSAFTMDQGTGRLARIPNSPFPAAPSPYSVGVDPSDRFLLVGNDDADEVSVFSIEATPGDGLRQVAGSPFVVHGFQPEFAFVRFPGGT